MQTETLLPLSKIEDNLLNKPQPKAIGRVIGIRGPIILARLPTAALGEICQIELKSGELLNTHVISFNEDIISLAPIGDIKGLSPGSIIRNLGRAPSINSSQIVAGGVLDAEGNPYKSIQNSSKSTKSLHGCCFNLYSNPPSALDRKPISQALATGIRSIDALCTIGHGQRIGLFAGAGVGKSTLLGMIARNAAVDITVIALVGERGREVNEFIENSLGPEGLKKSILVVATSDETPLKRSIAPITATAIAEYYRDQGKQVLLLVDSLTRTARAIRDVSLASGDLPIRQGLTATVFTELPKLIERAGNNKKGSITAIYTILESGEHELDPLAEELKSLLDGHISLDSKIAQQGIRPAIDFTRSISRLFISLQNREHIANAGKILFMISRLKRERDLILMGGTPDEQLREMLSNEIQLNKFLSQGINEKIELLNSLEECSKISRCYN